ncbi:MAG TPA: endonuclease/exonuclease/phosphatase family protein [Candidatus Binatia bacterium]|nr:endonuclease/exonuclease/phosphatase family protein [Candidatus Binatia bacterium]
MWWIRFFDFPRTQIAVIGTVALAVDLAFRTEGGTTAQVIRAALALCILYQAYEIRPYTIFARKEVEPAKNSRPEGTLSLLLANVKMENRNSARLREIIAQADPDVILIVEADAWWDSELACFAQSHAFNVRRAQENFYGMLLYSRLELVRSEVRFLIQDDIPSIRAGIKLAEGIEVEIHCLHPRPPVPQETAQSTERDAELIVVGKESKGKQLPIVVMGDLNDVAWSRTNYLFQRISGLIDPRIGRGLYNSFHAGYFFLRFPLDHFFHSTHFRLIELKRLAYFGSDHFPMFIRLSYEPEAERQQQAPQTHPSDEVEASEKIEEAATGA